MASLLASLVALGVLVASPPDSVAIGFALLSLPFLLTLACVCAYLAARLEPDYVFLRGIKQFSPRTSYLVLASFLAFGLLMTSLFVAITPTSMVATPPFLAGAVLFASLVGSALPIWSFIPRWQEHQRPLIGWTALAIVILAFGLLGQIWREPLAPVGWGALVGIFGMFDVAIALEFVLVARHATHPP